MDKMLDYIEKRVDAIDRAQGHNDKRLAKLERMARILRAGYVRIYNWHYARTHSRTAEDKRMLAKAKAWAVAFKKYDATFYQLANVAAQMRKGRRLMLLSDREYRLLKSQLKGRC